MDEWHKGQVDTIEARRMERGMYAAEGQAMAKRGRVGRGCNKKKGKRRNKTGPKRGGTHLPHSRVAGLEKL